MLIEPIATTTASRTDADETDRSGLRYLKRILAETLRSAAAAFLELLRPCWVPCELAPGVVPVSASVVQANTRYNFHCSTSNSGWVVGVLPARRALPGS